MINPREYIEGQYNAVASYLCNRENMRVIPNHIEGLLDSVKLSEQARDYQIQCAAQWALVRQAKVEIERELVPMAKRREFEARLAYMIAREVVPVYGKLDPTIKDLPAKLSNCRVCGKVGMDAGGDKRFFWDTKCNCSKMCPDEMRYEGQRIAERYIPAMVANLHGVFRNDKTQARVTRRPKLQKFVISPRNVPLGDLKETKARLFKTWSNINRRSVCKGIIGALVVQEDPLAAGEESWNVHLNVLAVVAGQFDWGDFRREFANMWGDDDVQIDFVTEHRMMELSRRKRARRGDTLPVTRESMLIDACNEMVKYVCKIVGSDHAGVESDRLEAKPMDQWPAAAWFEWYQSNKGFRRTRSYGELYNTSEPENEELAVHAFGFIKLDTSDSARFRYALRVPSIDLIPADKFAETDRHFHYFDHYSGPPN